MVPEEIESHLSLEFASSSFILEPLGGRMLAEIEALEEGVSLLINDV